MLGTSVSLFEFFGNAVGFTGFGRSGGERRGEAKTVAMPKDRLRRSAGAANENAARGLTPIVSMAVSVCPVPPIVKRAS